MSLTIRALAALTLIALGACGKKADPVASTTASPTTVAPTTAPPKKEEPPKVEPPEQEPPEVEPLKDEPPKGDSVVPQALIDQLTEQDGSTDFELTIEKATACAKTTKGDPGECDRTDWYGVFAFHPDGRVAIVSTKDAGGCGDGQDRFGFYAALSDLSPTEVVPMPWSADDDGDAQRVALWAWLGKAVKDGFTLRGVDIRNGHVDVEAGIITHAPLLRLGGKLDKHWLWAHAAPDGAASLITLVAPDNKARWDLGRVSHVDMKCKRPRTDDDEPCEDARVPGLVEVVPTPDGKALVVTAYASAAVHCGPRFVSHHVLALPEALPSPTP